MKWHLASAFAGGLAKCMYDVSYLNLSCLLPFGQFLLSGSFLYSNHENMIVLCHVNRMAQNSASCYLNAELSYFML